LCHSAVESFLALLTRAFLRRDILLLVALIEDPPMLTLSVRGLPRSTTEQSLTELLSRHGRVHNLKMAKDLFSGECRGFATVEMEGHEARNAIAAMDGSSVEGGQLRVGLDKPRVGRGGGRR